MTTTSSLLSSTQGTGTANTTSKAAASKDQLAADMNQFLKLLTSQLANQDPLSPMDSTEFTNQLVQYANVEQNIQTNENLENLISVQQAAMTLSSANYIGKTITAATTALPLQDGSATFAYEFEQVPEAASIQIVNSQGTVVKTITPELSKGSHTVTWDGKNDYGVQQDDGGYTVRISAADAEEKTIDSTVVVTGKVTGVSVYGGDVTLKMGGASTSLSNIQSIDESL